MKKLLLGLTLLASMSSFANTQTCNIDIHLNGGLRSGDVEMKSLAERLFEEKGYIIDSSNEGSQFDYSYNRHYTDADGRMGSQGLANDLKYVFVTIPKSKITLHSKLSVYTPEKGRTTIYESAHQPIKQDGYFKERSLDRNLEKLENAIKALPNCSDVQL